MNIISEEENKKIFHRNEVTDKRVIEKQKPQKCIDALFNFYAKKDKNDYSTAE